MNRYGSRALLTLLVTLNLFYIAYYGYYFIYLSPELIGRNAVHLDRIRTENVVAAILNIIWAFNWILFTIRMKLDEIRIVTNINIALSASFGWIILTPIYTIGLDKIVRLSFSAMTSPGILALLGGILLLCVVVVAIIGVMIFLGLVFSRLDEVKARS